MLLKIDLPNDEVCFGCPCESENEGREYCTMGHWNWETYYLAWYCEATNTYEIGQIPYDKRDRSYVKTVLRPAKCVRQHGE